MRRYGAALMAVGLLFALTATISAGADIPDLKGTWVIQATWIGSVKPNESPPPKLHPEKLGFHEVEFLLMIDQQEGFRFSGSRESSRKKETVSGVIGFDNQSVYMVDDDGMIFGKLISPDRMETIYLHVTKHHSIASREIMIRKR